MTARLEGVIVEITCRLCGRQVLRDLGSIAGMLSEGAVASLRQTLRRLHRKARCNECNGRRVALAICYNASERATAAPITEPNRIGQTATGRWQDRKSWSRLARKVAG